MLMDSSMRKKIEKIFIARGRHLSFAHSLASKVFNFLPYSFNVSDLCFQEMDKLRSAFKIHCH